MKTTVEISDALYDEAKRIARNKGCPFRAVLESALRRLIEEEASQKGPFRLRKHPYGGRGTQAGVNEGEWEKVSSLIYDGRGG